MSSAVPAAAQSSSSSSTTSIKHPLKPDVKGTLGVGLIGAELGMVLPALAGMDDTWAFIVFPVIGAAGGAAAGYFGLEKGGHTELAVASLTLGMGLFIPALVITISETQYDPADDESDMGTGALRGRRMARLNLNDPRNAGAGMLRLAPGGMAVATPGFALVPASASSARGRDAKAVAGLELSVLSGRF